MIRPRAWLGAATVAAIAMTGCGGPAKKKPLTMQEMVVADPLPLAKGARWTYQVTVKRYDADADKETTMTLSWVTEVVDAREANGVTAFRIKGWPSDLTALDAPVPVATERTILRHGNRFMFGASPEPSLEGAEGWFVWPVLDGQTRCPQREIKYCWKVTALETGYRLSYLTGPEEQSYDLEPGTGVARFHYADHGTTSEVEAKLVSYAKPGRR